MKKFIILLNDHLSQFWFTLLFLTLGCFIIFFLDPSGAIIVFGKNWEFDKISDVIGSFWMTFLLPLSIVSIAISTTIWLKDKTGNSHRGLYALIITIASLAFIFLFMIKTEMLYQNIKNGTSIFSTPIINVPSNIQSVQ
jgi:hypothetical protein